MGGPQGDVKVRQSKQSGLHAKPADLEDVLGIQQAGVNLGGGFIAQAHHKDLS